MQSNLICTIRQMPINCVVAKIGFAADKPASERRPGKITDLLKWPMPKNALRLFSPELIARREGSATKRQCFLRYAHWRRTGGQPMTNNK
jgi:hypothetical protein